MADTHTYKFNVSMSCSGCSGAVDRVLKKLEGKPVPVPVPVQPTLPSSLPRSPTEDEMESRTKRHRSRTHS